MNAPLETQSEATERAPGPLYRSKKDRVIAGVAGGLGEYFGVDSIWFRIGFVVLALGGGSGVVIYLLMWLLVPERSTGDEVASPRARLDGATVLGAVLILVGTVALMNTVAPWLGRYMWPLILVLGGFALLMGGLRK